MTKNLNIDKFRNGDPIPHAKTEWEWKKAGQNGEPAWCYYDNDPSNGERYGKLYNWFAVNDPRGLAPEGWHIPSDKEWMELTDFLGDNAGKKMKSTNGWVKNGNGTNKSGFSGLPGGYCLHYRSFLFIGEVGYWWSSSANYAGNAWSQRLIYLSDDLGKFNFSTGYGLSVRCIRD
jgi:uncharacterized protein (TIGR02145 family)